MKAKWNRIKDILEKIVIAVGIVVWAGVYLGIVYLFTKIVSPEEIYTLVIPFFFAWTIIWGLVAMPLFTLLGRKKIQVVPSKCIINI